MIGYDLYNFGRDYIVPRDLGLQRMPAGATEPSVSSKPSMISSLWGKAKKAISGAPTTWGDGGPVAEGGATGALATGVNALSGLFQMGEDEREQQRAYGSQELQLANDLYESRRKRMQQTNALRAAAAVR